jgi:uncharacterized protein YbjT (DUF2867 family)
MRLLIFGATGATGGPLARYALEAGHTVTAVTVDWTIVRPPRLTNGEPRGRYRVAIDRFLARPMTIARKDVAGYMLGNVSNDATYKHTVEIGY